MNKKLFGNKTRLVIIAGAIVIVGIIVAIICFLCLKPKEEDVYDAKLKDIYQVITASEGEETFYDGLQSVRDAVLEFGDEALDKISYVCKDMNNDGKEELFIGCFDNEDSSDVNNELYAAFSYDENGLTPLFEKQKRNTYALTDAGTIYFYGTDGANYYILGEYQLGEEGDLICKDFYFTYPKNGDGNNFCYYHNTTGVWDAEGSEEIQMTPEEFEEKRKEIASRTEPLEGVKFSEIGQQ